jgi:hypothetical protein
MNHIELRNAQQEQANQTSESLATSRRQLWESLWRETNNLRVEYNRMAPTWTKVEGEANESRFWLTLRHTHDDQLGMRSIRSVKVEALPTEFVVTFRPPDQTPIP